MTASLPRFMQSTESAARWLMRYAGDQFNPDDLPEEWSASYRKQFVKERAYETAGAYLAQAYDITRAGVATIYRAIRIPRDGGLHNINWDCLGKSWSAVYEGAGVYGDAPPTGPDYREVVLVGTVTPDNIDWAYGFYSFAAYGEDQWEISLLPKAPVEIREVILRPSHEHRMLSTPISGNTGTAGEVWRDTCKEVVAVRRDLKQREAALKGWRR